MPQSAKELQSYSLYATDGDVGSAEAFFFDDQSWQIRYLVANAGGLLINRQEVLVAPEFVEKVDQDTQILYTKLTKEQVKNSPPIETDRPVADQQELTYYDYYGADPYWAGGWGATTGLAGVPPYAGAYPGAYGAVAESAGSEAAREKRGDPHLRSTREVAGYRIQATDGEIGHVEDFIVDDEEWAIRYIVVDTRNWLPGNKVLISVRWISGVSWPEMEVYVDLTQDEIKSAPQWDPDTPVDCEYETRLHEHYGRPPYWVYR